MPRISTSGRTVTSKDGLVSRIKANKMLPIISGDALADIVLGGQCKVVEKFAEASEYPLPDTDDLPKMARTWAIDQKKDPWELKEFYLDVVKTFILDDAEARGIDQDKLDEAEDEFDNLTASNIAKDLQYLEFESGRQDPLLILANFQLPIYLTTCSFSFVEQALQEAGIKKENIHTDYFRWHEGLEEGTSIFDNYSPSPEEPLVYHLFGVDDQPDSLVLTEDDYLRFLIAISSEKGRTSDILPDKITSALNTSSVVMLGFQLQSWAFRTIFWGLVKNSRRDQKGEINLQLAQEERPFLEKYLRAEARFEVQWKDMNKYLQDLDAERRKI